MQQAPLVFCAMNVAQMNLTFAWLWIALGFLSGLVLGLFFDRETWPGGYASFRRRLYRLAHVSFFGLGTLNLLFYLTAPQINAETSLSAASLLLIVGGVAMPVCCCIVAHWRKAKMIFAVPVISLVAGGIITLVEVWSL